MSYKQSFEEIKASCLRSGRLYEDPDFEAVDDNVFTSRRPPRPFVWRRPTVSKPFSYILLYVATVLPRAMGNAMKPSLKTWPRPIYNGAFNLGLIAIVSGVACVFFIK